MSPSVCARLTNRAQAYALYRTRLPISITHQALLLLSRLKARYPSARGTATSPHRLFLSSLMLSSKISMDDTYSNRSWQVVGQGLFELREVNQMERELFAFLGWNVVVRDEELIAWVDDVVGEYISLTQPTPTMEDRKRRRDHSSLSVASVSRSPSPDAREARHRRASDAAQALLHGDADSSSRARRSRPRSPPCADDAHGSESSSTCSSQASSPTSGSTTPGSPGPLTPVDGSPPSTSLDPASTHWLKSQAHAHEPLVSSVGDLRVGAW